MNFLFSLNEERQFMKHSFTLFQEEIEKNKLLILYNCEKNRIILEHYDLLNDIYFFILTEFQPKKNEIYQKNLINDTYLIYFLKMINQRMNQVLSYYKQKKYQEINYYINDIIFLFENQHLLNYISKKPYVYQIYHYYVLSIYISYLLTNHEHYLDLVSSCIIDFS